MKISHVIRTLVVSDFLINSGFSIFGPILAVFVTKQIVGGSLEVVGFATAIGQACKVGLQIPVARILDKNHGEYDDFLSLFVGSVLIAFVPFLYYFAKEATHLYFIQAIYGVGAALAVPPWYAIFTRHIDRMRENVEWSMESVAIGISGAGAAAIGGVLAERLGFQTIFLIGGCLAVIGAGVQLFIFSDLKRKVARGVVKPAPDR